MSRLVRVVAGRHDHGPGIGHVRLLERGGQPRIALDHGNSAVEKLAEQERLAVHLDSHDRLTQLEQLFDDLVADPADDDEYVIATERGEHSILLRLILLAAEDQECQPDQRVGDRTQPDQGQSEEERLKISLVRKVDQGFQEEHQENRVTRPAEGERLMMVAEPECRAPAEHQSH
jgi:hypothetical protein